MNLDICQNEDGAGACLTRVCVCVCARPRMSIRRTQQTINSLWNFSMEEHEPAYHDTESGYAVYKDHPHTCQSELHAASMQPPRLQSASCCSRIVLVAMCCLCTCFTVLVFSFIATLPVVEGARESFTMRIQAEPPPRPKPLPAILRRFATLKRATPPQKGIDLQSVDAAFPSWRFGADEGFDITAFAGDLALAMTALVVRIEPDSRVMRRTLFSPPPPPPPPPPMPPPPPPPPPPQPPQESELYAINGEFDEDEEL